MPQQDQQLINNLLQQQNTGSYAKELAQEVQSSISDNQLIVSRVVTAKYKIYVIILLIIGVILGTNFAPNAWKTFQATQAVFEEKENKIQMLNQTLQHYGEQKKSRKLTENSQEQIISCINNKQDCETLSPDITDQLSLARSYLQLGKLKSEKMEIDEKKILKNLDQYLIRENPSEHASPRNGEIISIEIGSGESVNTENKFYKLPLTVKVIFDDKDQLVSFVNNIEQYIIPNPEDRIFYHIDEVAYDMTAYSESQETELKLTAYYFKE